MNDILGAEKVIAIFGKWPTFYDAEVWSVGCDRTERGADVTAVVHVFEASSKIDLRGDYQLAKHTRVTFRFSDCADIELENFNGQNALSLLDVGCEPSDTDRPFRVIFAGTYGLDGHLSCRQIEVVEAVPWVPPHGKYAGKKRD